MFLLVAGCATVPTKGTIRSGSREGLAPDFGGVGVEAKPPRADAKPLPLVNGFLEAMSDSRAFDVAREYMTPAAAAAGVMYSRATSNARESDIASRNPFTSGNGLASARGGFASTPTPPKSGASPSRLPLRMV